MALAIGLFTGIGTGGSKGRPQAGDQVPAFSLPRLAGTGRGNVGVPGDGGANGRPAVVLFFASWCAPCQGELPGLAATYHQQQASGSRLAKVALIGVDVADPVGGQRFVRSAGVTFPVGTDRNYNLTEGTFYFTGLPEVVFVNGDGSIAAIDYGAITPAQLVSWQQRLLSGG